MDVVLGPRGTGRETERRGEASAASPRQRTRSPPRRTTRSPERRPFGGTGNNSARIMQELRHRMQDLERRLADREHHQQTPESSYSRSVSRSRSRRTASPQSEPENARECGRARRRHDPLIYARHDRRTTERNCEDTRREDNEGRTTRTQGPVIMAQPHSIVPSSRSSCQNTLKSQRT
nr:probable splicing factor, arginine/serine-rich 5 [Arachis hypogaea]